MLETNVPQVLSRVSPNDEVLDVGGWACPFNRANWVMDAEPYETRGFFGKYGLPPSQGGSQEFFTKDTWIQRDICDRAPWPFADKQLDFVICSHTLEDVRDPLGVCSEMIRVAKRGYIEFPSREWETCRGLERGNQAGLSHHRWLIDIEGNHLRFLPKYHLIHSHWRFSFPSSHLKNLSGDRASACFWWEESFSFREVTIHGVPAMEAELESYVRSKRPVPEWIRLLDRRLRETSSLRNRIVGKIRRSLAR